MNLQDRRWKIETAKALRLEAALVEVKDEERRLGFLFEGDDMCVLVFPDLVLRRLRSTTQRRENAVIELEHQLKFAREQARRLKWIERALERAERERRARDAAKDLAELLDRVGRWSKVSAP
jgi:hypothetical protein